MRNSKSALEKVNEYLNANPEASKRAACEAVGVAEQTYYKARRAEGAGKPGRKTRKTPIVDQTLFSQFQTVQAAQFNLKVALREAIKKQIDVNKAVDDVVNEMFNS